MSLSLFIRIVLKKLPESGSFMTPFVIHCHTFTLSWIRNVGTVQFRLKKDTIHLADLSKKENLSITTGKVLYYYNTIA